MPYVYAGLLVGVGAIARLALDPLLGDRVVFLMFVPALIVAASTGGLLPGLTATAASVAVGVALLARYGVILGNQVDASLFACLGVAVAFGGEWLRRARSHAAEMTTHVLERQDHLKSILDTVPDAMIVIDESGEIQTFGPAAETLFQWSKSEVVGQNVRMLMPSPDREAHDSYLEHYARTGERRIVGLPRTVTAQRKDGSLVIVELYVGETGSGDRKFYTGFLRDLTERNASDARLRGLEAELAHISRLSAMGEMASSLAHELNQPLSAISNYLKGGLMVLQRENPKSRALGPMDKAAEQSLRAGEIIRRLRNFVASGDTERSQASLKTLMEEASALGLVGARERGVTTRMEWDPAVDGVLVDKVQVQQVVLNLLRNAVEAMEDVERRELHVKTGMAPDGMTMVSVADTGCGLSPQIADQLFEPFVTTKGAQGMGVGLSISRSIIEAHGGRIWAEPNPLGGTVFRFTLPAAVSGSSPGEHRLGFPSNSIGT
ncbi:MAG TPA: PAS domain S-box protein [Caulobacteraceae bacterium]